jgi:23S rRNA (cytidine1920-2'-O)/16S rRNA (cytidine1409-2'-O)-methyltransferase
VRRGLAASRTEAQRAVEDGRVLVDGAVASKAAHLIDPGQAVVVAPADPGWASRGGGKLVAALDSFGIDVTGAKALDVGASTGGFTDVLIRRGAAKVVAVDVGYGQMISRLANDHRVEVRDRTNFRVADPADLGAPFDVVVMDVSFIGAALLAPQLAACGRDITTYVVLVKPQFEVGPERVGRGGIVRDPDAHADAVGAVADALQAVGIGALGAMPAPIRGAGGNQEFLLHGVHGAESRDARSLGMEAVA